MGKCFIFTRQQLVVVCLGMCLLFAPSLSNAKKLTTKICEKALDCLVDGMVATISPCKVTEVAACAVFSNLSNQSNYTQYIKHNFACWLVEKAFVVAMGGGDPANLFLATFVDTAIQNAMGKVDCATATKQVDVCTIMEEQLHDVVDTTC